jgi:hypothetical protein
MSVKLESGSMVYVTIFETSRRISPGRKILRNVLDWFLSVSAEGAGVEHCS